MAMTEEKAHLQEALQQHEDRIAAMLESHRQQLTESLAQQLQRASLEAPRATRPGQRPRTPSTLREQIERVYSDSGPGDLSTDLSQLQRIGETVTEVNRNLYSGEVEVLNWFEASFRQDCCHSICCKPIRRYAGLVYKSRWFELFISLAIVLNAVFIGLDAEWSLQTGGSPAPLWYGVAAYCFVVVFVGELVVRWVTEGCFYLNPKNANFGWNVFDLFLVLSSVVEHLLEAMHALALNVSFMRLARILRLMRVMRMLRVLKQFKELRIMVHGMLNCGKPLLWASLLLCLLAYINVVLVLQVSAEWLESVQRGSEISDEHATGVKFINSDFGSLRYGMYTLLKCITGGVSWQEVADPLAEISPFLIAVFLLYVLIGLACLLNIITAVFLEAAYDRSHSDASVLLEHIEHKRKWIAEAQVFFHSEFEQHFGVAGPDAEVQTPRDVTVEEFTRVVQAPRVRAWFEEHELDIYFEDPKSLFELIDLDADRKLDIDEFVAGLYRLKGGASSLNLQLELRQVQSKLSRVLKAVAKSRSRKLTLQSQLNAIGSARPDADQSPSEKPPTPLDSEGLAAKWEQRGVTPEPEPLISDERNA